jgi:hypothetical protein
MTSRPRRPDNVRLVTALIVALTGIVWIGQGLGYLASDSFMVGDPAWAAIGLGMIGLAVFLAGRELYLRRRG